MKTLHTHDLETREKFDDIFLRFFKTTELNGYHSDIDLAVKQYITNSHKQLYIKIAEGEIERLNKAFVKCELCENNEIHDDPYNRAIQDSIDTWNNILQELNK